MAVFGNRRVSLRMDANRMMIDKARKLANFCIDHGFDGVSIFKGLKVSQLASMYDGIGPNWSWRVVIDIVEHIDNEFEPAAFLLDVQYRAESDRSDENFHRCNRQFLENCNKCVKEKYGWWSLKRYRKLKSAKVLFDACEEHGYKSWQNQGATGQEQQ